MPKAHMFFRSRFLILFFAFSFFDIPGLLSVVSATEPVLHKAEGTYFRIFKNVQRNIDELEARANGGSLSLGSQAGAEFANLDLITTKTDHITGATTQSPLVQPVIPNFENLSNNFDFPVGTQFATPYPDQSSESATNTDSSKQEDLGYQKTISRWFCNGDAKLELNFKCHFNSTIGAKQAKYAAKNAADLACATENATGPEATSNASGRTDAAAAAAKSALDGSTLVKAATQKCLAANNAYIESILAYKAAVKEDQEKCSSRVDPEMQTALNRTKNLINTKCHPESRPLHLSNANTAAVNGIKTIISELAEKATRLDQFSTGEEQKAQALAAKKQSYMTMALGALGLAGAVAAWNLYDARHDDEEHGAPPPPEEEKKDPPCSQRDYACQCQAGRQSRPVLCDNRCMQNGVPNSACLTSYYGPGFSNLTFDSQGNVRDNSDYSSLGTTTPTAGTPTGSGGGSGSSGGGGQSPNSAGGGGGGGFGGSGGSGLTANSVDPRKNEVAGDKKGNPFAGSSDVGGGSGYSGGRGGGYRGGSQDPRLTGRMPTAESVALQRDRAQLAPAGSNIFGNISNAYQAQARSLIP